MNLYYNATHELPQPRGRCDLPQVVKNGPKKCARRALRPESDPKVFRPTISVFSKVMQKWVPPLSGRKRAHE